MANLEHTASAKRKCVGCGAELPGNTPPDLCPKCLLKLAMETQAATSPAGTVMVSGAEAMSRGLPQPGEQFGHYTIIRALGTGGMGAVYEAEDLESGRRVALKVLSHRLDSPESRERFFREGRLAASINHPNSVYIFGTEEIGGIPVITMELVPGGTLQDRVRARGPLPIGEAVVAVLQLIEGLEAAQRLGILHRDIKPSNCYVGEDGAVKIGDFGLSISTALRTEPALTATGAFLGTPAFCSPEQLRGDELNARSDMYSVGVTLYYLLTGRTPFESGNMVQLLATVLEQRPPSPRQFRPEIPKELAKGILRCLEKQPGERFRTYADLARALSPYASTAPTPATLGLRFLAAVVDMTLLGSLALVINLSVFGSLMAFMDQAMQGSPKLLVCMAGWFCITILYYGVFEGLWGAGAGKLLCGLRVAGPDRNPPGILRAGLRVLVYLVPPMLPYWLGFGLNPKAYLSSPQWVQLLVSASIYVIMALLFITARRRNGFAALQDLLSGTRVISRTAFSARPGLSVSEAPPPNLDSAPTVGPYHVLQPLADSGGVKWVLAYDLKLLRKVWLREVPPGTPPVPPPLRNLGRVGRLRWLTGKRSPEENWDAFEAPTGQPFLELVRHPQPWRDVRYWLHDLAGEISAAEKDGTLPELALDRVWITVEGRAKLFDFPAPGLASSLSSQPPVTRSPTPPLASFNASTLQPFNAFLNAVAATALAGSPGAWTQPAAEVGMPLPLYARAFLRSLTQMAGADTVAAALKPLLTRVAVVSHARRAALVLGCIAFPVLAGLAGSYGLGYMRELTRKNPGLMDVSTLCSIRTSGRFWGGKKAHLPTDREFAIYIASHYRGVITNATVWSSPWALGMVNGESRKFAEQSVADHPAPTTNEVAEADAAVSKYVPKEQPLAVTPSSGLWAMVGTVTLAVYVALPALVAALLFRGGLVLLLAGVTYVKRDGQRASRLRLLWRAVVTWCPAFPALALTFVGLQMHWTWQPWLALALLGMLAAVSVALPERGIQDRLAGTWPVPR
jgi:eukaryotic-like serine/threonine-protein kinase